MIDPVLLLQELIRCPSITPLDAGAQDVLKKKLNELGFEIYNLPFGKGKDKIVNFFARYGKDSPHLCFAGHTDVVPAGASEWKSDPFSATIENNILYGRGACDMKGGIAAYLSAAEAFIVKNKSFKGSLSFLITGDEEGLGINGTVKVLQWMKDHDQLPDFCIVGEPSCTEQLGDTIKIGRRGSLNAVIRVEGLQGHVAYPHLAVNPVHQMINILSSLIDPPLDAGNEWFQPSSVQVTSVDVNNTVTNLIPQEALARINIRFNNLHKGASLKKWINMHCHRITDKVRVDVSISGESFLTNPGKEVHTLINAIENTMGKSPKLDTNGGTSDARFISQYCSVAEFGLVGQTMHKANESVPIHDLIHLTEIYYKYMELYFQ